jgi:hypothetical protein
VGVLLALFALSQVFLALPAGRFADRHGLKRPIMVSVLTASAGAGLSAAFPLFEVLCVSALMMGGASGTLTSLSGFDALLRGKPVTTYGLPFYAGWGLTTDKAVFPASCLARRTRQLRLDELVAGALLRYPVYWDHDLKGVTTCMAVLLRIQAQRDALQAQGRLHQLKHGFWRRNLRKLKNWLAISSSAQKVAFIQTNL